MMYQRNYSALSLTLGVFFSLVSCGAMANPIELTEKFLRSLTSSQQKKVRYSFGDTERFNWDYWPKTRNGVSLKELSKPQRDLLDQVLRGVLSPKGFQSVSKVIEREAILGRDAGLYYVTVFGSPSQGNTWGLRFEGHHLSINATLRGQDVLSLTPFCLGSNPEVPEGRSDADGLFNVEVETARGLMKQFSKSQKKKAWLSTTFALGSYFGGFTVSKNKKYSLKNFKGLSSKEMTAGQKKQLLSVVQNYLSNGQESFIKQYMPRITNSKMPVYFSWVGSLKPKHEFSFAIHGERFFFEVVGSQDDGNHLHVLWRDKDLDFGV